MDNISEDETKSVSNDRLDIIEKIKAYESECLFAIRTVPLNSHVRSELKKVIYLIEKELNKWLCSTYYNCKLKNIIIEQFKNHQHKLNHKGKYLTILNHRSLEDSTIGVWKTQP